MKKAVTWSQLITIAILVTAVVVQDATIGRQRAELQSSLSVTADFGMCVAGMRLTSIGFAACVEELKQCRDGSGI